MAAKCHKAALVIYARRENWNRRYLPSGGVMGRSMAQVRLVCLTAVVQHGAVEVVSVDSVNQHRHKLRVRQAKRSGSRLKSNTGLIRQAQHKVCRSCIARRSGQTLLPRPRWSP